MIRNSLLRNFQVPRLVPLRTAQSFVTLSSRLSFKPRPVSLARNFSCSAWRRAVDPYPSQIQAATQPGLNTKRIPKPPQPLGKPRLISSKPVAYWLLFSAAAVFGIVVLGGLTRLTESGLSITEWRPITGSLPPRSEEQWLEEFSKYRESPEFKELNSNITLEDFKFIYYMEWSHRLWGRAIGMLILIPGLYFVLRKRTSPSTNRKLVGISLLLALQGFIGWWMVKSGLEKENLASRVDSQPRVSHYRLATHLGAAFLLYFAMTLEGLGILKEHRMVKNPAQSLTDLKLLTSPIATPLRRFGIALLALAFVTSMSGAFVAGLDAGLLYNTFPLMGGRLTPPASELYSDHYAPNAKSATERIVKNSLDNPVTVQLNHRILAVTTWTATALLFLASRKRRNLLPRYVYKGAHGAIGFATLQAALGITTLIYVCPVPVAALHQSGALAFLTMLLIFINRLRVPRQQIRQLISVMANQKK